MSALPVQVSNEASEGTAMSLPEVDKCPVVLAGSDRPQPDEAKKDDDLGEKASFFALFRYADAFDCILILISFVCSLATGAALPAFTLFFKDLINGGFESGSLSASKVNEKALLFLWISLGLLVCGSISNGAMLLAAANQGSRLRRQYVKAILRQNVAWFDTQKTGEITTSIERDCSNVQGAIGEKAVLFVHNLSTFVFGIALGFWQGWEMALVLCACLPLLAGAGAWMAKSLADLATKGEQAYRSAGAVAEQAITGIRTVASLRGEQRENQRYCSNLDEALDMGIKKARTNALGMGSVMGSFMGTYALGLWFGSWLIVHGVTNSRTGVLYSAGDVILVFFSVVMGGFSLGQVGPCVQAFMKGQASAKRIFDIIDRKPPIDIEDPSGEKPASVKGDICLKGIAFTYPARQDAPIFTNLDLNIAAGQTAALVGASGSGKSTVIQLLLRFYDPDAGQVMLDGRDLRTLNVKWLREHLSIVSQEPILFAVSIAENIKYGKPDASMDEIEKASVASNAHMFISGLPGKYDTLCGERGTQLSGGQKQRIAIARAIISNPKVLLLDEATSALDSESEKLVQGALDNLMDGRTVVVVAHRLSTIRNADKICVFQTGTIVEEGTHEELYAKQDGFYRELVSKQMMAGEAAVGGTPATTEEKPTQASQPVQDTVSATKSTTDVVLKEVSEEEKKAEKGYLSRAFKLNSPEFFPWALTGSIGACLNGALFPVLALLLTEMLAGYSMCLEKENVDPFNPGKKVVFSIFMDDTSCDTSCVYRNGQWIGTCTALNNTRMWCYQVPNVDPVFFYRFYSEPSVCFNLMETKIVKYCYGFVGLAVAAFVANFLQLFSFGIMGEHLTQRLRKLCFASVLRQDVGFFDYTENASGSLTTKLAKDASLVENAVGTTIGLMIQNIVVMAISLTIAFIRGWMLTLICFSTFPLMVIADMLQMQFIAGSGGDLSKAYEVPVVICVALRSCHGLISTRVSYVQMFSLMLLLFFQKATAIASEAVAGLRTVAAFSAEEKVEDLYHSALDSDTGGQRKTALAAGVGQGFSLFTMFFLYYCGFAGGAYLMDHHGYTFKDVLQVFFSVTFMGMAAGMAGSLAPDIAKGKPALIAIFKLIDRVPKIDIQDEGGERPASVKGDIELRNVHFAYPARPEAQIFSGLNLTINAGQTVALVGSSGSGKSTIISLIERFYEPDQGQVLLDGKDIKTLNLSWLRSHLGLVSQEPVLFATSIYENILYGREDARKEEVYEAAKRANAYDFIMNLPGNFETESGERGTQLSGGQKQRIAIARAMVSNPNILLLDEATSALDSQSEKIVQKALENLMVGRTVVVVAHRLSTIQNADNIMVFSKGSVMEQGRHSELIKNPAGPYSKLIAHQMQA
ncbi:hypothetical protein GUITHDRAFT_100562 [Guillardia theta CCMP2712]|uniref:Uncharacterized protein n=1 Tax=Guillardia theta (strain CCMP2712) TaxID=905079 RepID=L1JZN2_GUITC|nr:hypothetical protein GUITHDRAFT_100562 [Guillardia theta CCMP2712]EKX53578.1 hypothetical protein GUITHDRAFT_100562 [Guillardia theta CCMP2712]|eukprot:XP_005840558.1 hypothetical protein GUITHDRAFT_100562 [Guillardia theta CCMP2712]